MVAGDVYHYPSVGQPLPSISLLGCELGHLVGRRIFSCAQSCGHARAVRYALRGVMRDRGRRHYGRRHIGLIRYSRGVACLQGPVNRLYAPVIPSLREVLSRSSLDRGAKHHRVCPDIGQVVSGGSYVQRLLSSPPELGHDRLYHGRPDYRRAKRRPSRPRRRYYYAL